MVIVQENLNDSPEYTDPRDASLDDSVVFCINGIGSARQNYLYWHGEFVKTSELEARIPQSLKSYDEYVALGTQILNHARHTEAESGSIEAANLYHQARIQLMGAVRRRPLPEDISQADASTVGADVLFLIADCLDKEALAPETFSPLIWNVARRKHLRQQAENTRVTASLMTSEVHLAA